MKRTFAGVALFVLLFSSGALGVDRKAAEEHADRIDEYMTRLHEFEVFSGAILVAEEGEIVYKKGFGPANRQWNIPNEPHTRFRIGSRRTRLTFAKRVISA